MANIAEEVAQAALMLLKKGKTGKAATILARELGTAKPTSQLARSAGFRAPGTGMAEAPEPLSHGRISQRYPTAVSKTEDPLMQNLLINMHTLKQDPKATQQAADLVNTYAGTTNAMKEMHPAERLDAFHDQAVENYLALWDLMTPEQQARASRWYHGANRISQERAQEVGIHPYAAAGTYAALSPQMDWFKNVYLGDAVLRTLQRDPKVSRDMLRNAAENKLLGSFREKEIPQELAAIEGRNLSALTPREKALAIRLWDETYGGANRGRPAYHKINPEGDYGELVTNQGGDLAKPGWGNFRDIEKAVRAAESGGNPNLISPLMGEKHKVRNFYNDIVAPSAGAKFGDITADTHQIAGGQFSPFSGNSPEVAQGLGSAPSSSVTGVQGMYPVYADATRNAAAMRGVPTIAMQSTPWEAIRALFPAKFKTAGNMEKVNGIWRDHGAGRISAPEARKRIIKLAGGFNPPKWLIPIFAAMGLGGAIEDQRG